MPNSKQSYCHNKQVHPSSRICQSAIHLLLAGYITCNGKHLYHLLVKEQLDCDCGSKPQTMQYPWVRYLYDGMGM